jgi:hypothetical protein
MHFANIAGWSTTSIAVMAMESLIRTGATAGGTDAVITEPPADG